MACNIQVKRYYKIVCKIGKIEHGRKSIGIFNINLRLLACNNNNKFQAEVILQYILIYVGLQQSRIFIGTFKNEVFLLNANKDQIYIFIS